MVTLTGVVALARGASMSSTYKPALLKALVRLARDSTGTMIPLHAIGHEFVRLYWVQTVTFRLRQAATIASQPEVVRAIRETADRERVRDVARLAPEARARLDRQMVRILKINVLAAFHASKPVAMSRLYEWDPGADAIAVSREARAFLVAEAPALESLANLWWARYLEKVNVLAPLVIRKVERDGAERRASLVRFLRILASTGERRCFYCERELGGHDGVHVDHVIPWSSLLADPLWDLVLACVPCNLSKSDVLPHRDFLDRLATLGTTRAKATLPPGFGSPSIPRDELDRFYDAAIAVEWPSGSVPSLAG